LHLLDSRELLCGEGRQRRNMLCVCVCLSHSHTRRRARTHTHTHTINVIAQSVYMVCSVRIKQQKMRKGTGSELVAALSLLRCKASQGRPWGDCVPAESTQTAFYDLFARTEAMICLKDVFATEVSDRGH
jgi:hypothetical protein